MRTHSWRGWLIAHGLSITRWIAAKKMLRAWPLEVVDAPYVLRQLMNEEGVGQTDLVRQIHKAPLRIGS